MSYFSLMRILTIAFLLLFFPVEAQDTITSHYSSGALHSIEYRGESLRTRRDQELPIRIVYNEDSTVYCKLFAGGIRNNRIITKKRIWYENNIPVFGESDHCHNYFFEEGELIRKTTRNADTYVQPNCVEKFESRSYSVEEGVFQDYILHNGTISYYTANNTLTSAIQVRNGYRQNDAVIYFKDSTFFRQLRNMPNRVDLNENHHIEKSEAACVIRLEIKKRIRDFTGIQHFVNLQSIKYLGTSLDVSQYASFSQLIAKLKTIQSPRRDIDPVRWAEEAPPFYPNPCGCTRGDAKPIAYPAEIHDFVEVVASFVGGQQALQVWLDTNIVLPDRSIWKAENQGKVFVEFVVEKDGSITNVRILKSLSEEIDREAKRLVRKMPAWIPAKQDGIVVRSRVRMPIQYVPK